MNENKLLEQLKNAATDEQFMEGLFTSVDYQEFAEKLATKDIVVSDEEAKQLYEGMKSGTGELSEDNLDNIAGGFGVVGACWAIAGGCAFLYGCYKSFTKKCK